MINIPPRVGRNIAKEFGVDQVIIITRKIGTDGGESCTTYGVGKENSDAADAIGEFFKYKVMGWDPANVTEWVSDGDDWEEKDGLV